MLEELMRECRNWSCCAEWRSPWHIYTIKDGSVSLPFLVLGQYFRIVGSVFNDGVYQYGAGWLDRMKRLTVLCGRCLCSACLYFSGSEDVEAWRNKYESTANSPFQSESFAGYSYTKSSASGNSGGSVTGWQVCVCFSAEQMEKAMSLLDDFSHSCIIMDKLTKPDGEGGYATEWSDGAEFANYVALDSSLEARQAEAQGVTSVYTGIVRKDVPIEYGSVYKDVTTGAYFRVTSRPEEKRAPASASPMLQQPKKFYG